MSKQAKIIIVIIAIVILSIIAYFIFRKKPEVIDLTQLNDTKTTNDGVLSSSAPKFIENKFPLDVNMKGTYVLALQRALNRINSIRPIPEDGVFGPETKTKLLLTVSSSQSVLPMSGATWQQIIIDSNK